MPFNIEQFRSALVGDGSRANLFDITMNFPLTGPITDAVGAGQKATLMCRAAQLPGSTLGSIPLYYFGRDVKLAGNVMFQEWTTTIINDEDHKIRRAIEQWHNGLNSKISNLRDPNFENTFGYGVNSLVNHYGKDGSIIRQYQFVGMWPTDISPIDLDWQANDTIVEYSVAWAYQYWTAVTDNIV